MKKHYLFKKSDRIGFQVIFSIFIVLIMISILYINIYFFKGLMGEPTYIPLIITFIILLIASAYCFYITLFMQSYVIYNKNYITFICIIKKYNKRFSWSEVNKIEKIDMFFANQYGTNGYSKPFIVIRNNNLDVTVYDYTKEFLIGNNRLWYQTYIKKKDIIVMDFDDNIMNELTELKH